MSTITPSQRIASQAGPAAPPLADVYRMDTDEFERVADLLKAERVELIDGFIVERGAMDPPHVLSSWIVNLIDRQVEVYTGPNSDMYSSCIIFQHGESVPVVIDGVEVGQIAVAEILPRITPAAGSNGA